MCIILGILLGVPPVAHTDDHIDGPAAKVSPVLQQLACSAFPDNQTSKVREAEYLVECNCGEVGGACCVTEIERRGGCQGGCVEEGEDVRAGG